MVTLSALASFLIFPFWPSVMLEEFDGSRVYHSHKEKEEHIQEFTYFLPRLQTEFSWCHM